MQTFSREVFAAQRRGAQDRAIADLLPIVQTALDHYDERHDWWRVLLTPTHDLFTATLVSDSGGDVRSDVRAWTRLVDRIVAALQHQGRPDQFTARTLAVWLSTAAINAAATSAAANDPEGLLLVWVTMHDDKVRQSHRDTDGQERPPGEAFDVDGQKMMYPGDPSAPIEFWINCRCMARPMLATESAALQFASAPADNTKHRVIVALPSKDHPVHQVGDETKHMTMVNLGTPEENPDLDMDAVKGETAHLANDIPPFEAPVTGISKLGDEGANVWMHDPAPAAAVHDTLVANPVIGAAHQAVQQYPQFTPHTTINYGDAIPADATGVGSIPFDRLALWDGEDHTEFPLGGAMTDTTTEAPVKPDAAAIALTEPLAWHGVLAPEGVWSGDGRMFAENSLRFRDLPMPLTWQKASQGGHDGSVVVAKIEAIERVDNEMRAMGHWLLTPEADEAVGLLTDFGKFGVSVDADDAEFDFDENSDKVTFTSARIASASMVAIPAFAEAFIALGTGPEGFMPSVVSTDPGCDPAAPDYEDCVAKKKAAEAALEFVSDKPWSNFTQADYTPEQWKSACVLHLSDSLDKGQHKLPIKEPGGALNRNGVHAAAARFNQVQAPAEAKARAKSALRGAYSTLGEEVPDVLAALEGEVDEFGRGPGWITNPEDTKRIHDYWTVPGQPGYEKVQWGVAGDFERCKNEIGQEIAEKDPATVAKYMNQICAQWHHDATGFWPGHAPTEQALEGDPAPALSLVASAAVEPAAWFKDPGLAGLTPLQITDDGRVFGHLAGWKSCHTAFQGMCVAPPHSASGYAYFMTGEVLTDEGPVPVGQITVGGGHANGTLRPRAALAHYDSTSAAVCDVAAGEDEHGIWLAGRVRPGVSEEQVTALRASSLSGDWREVTPGAEYELIAALGVNSPGFPVPRVGINNGRQVSLVAAGAVPPWAMAQVGEFDVAALADRVVKELDERRERKAHLMALAAQVGGG